MVPPSANMYWRSRVIHKRAAPSIVLVYKTREGKEYAASCYLRAKSQVVGLLPYVGPVEVRGRVYFANRRRDLDNTLKPLLDALEGVGYGNDKQVVHLDIWKDLDASNPRVELTILPLQSDMIGRSDEECPEQSNPPASTPGEKPPAC